MGVPCVLANGFLDVLTNCGGCLFVSSLTSKKFTLGLFGLLLDASFHFVFFRQQHNKNLIKLMLLREILARSALSSKVRCTQEGHVPPVHGEKGVI